MVYFLRICSECSRCKREQHIQAAVKDTIQNVTALFSLSVQWFASGFLMLLLFILAAGGSEKKC